MGFTNVHIRKPRDEDTNVGGKNEFSAFNNLYEMLTLASIHGSVEDQENQSPDVNPSIKHNLKALCSDGWVIIGIGCEVILFSYDYEFTHRCTWTMKDPVVALTTLGSSDYFAVFTANREMHLLSTKSAAIIDSKNLCSDIAIEKVETATASSQTDEFANICQIVYNDNKFTAAITFESWEKMKSLKMTSPEEFQKGRFDDNISIRTKSTKWDFGDFHSLCGGDIVGIPKKAGTLQFVNINSLEFGSLDDYSNGTSFVRTRLTCDDRFLVGVTSLGKMVVRDMWTRCVAFHSDVIDPKEDGTVLDFIFTDSSDCDFSHDSIALVVLKDDEYQLQIRSISTGKMAYSVSIREGAIPLAAPLNSDRVMIVVEPLKKGLSCDDVKNAVKIREISETKPETRLDRLIARKQLDDAEKFAIEMGLDVQRVYEARMEMLINEVLESGVGESEVFNRLVKSMEAVKDHNLVGEQCYRGAMTFEKYEWINKMLSIASSRPIDDIEITNRLQHLKYVFATYRLVSGTSKDTNFSDNSLWNTFRRDIDSSDDEEDFWVNIFNDFVAVGCFQEAAIIFERHNAALRDGLVKPLSEEQEDVFPRLELFFDNITSAVKGNLDKWRQSIEFLEFTVLPTIISHAPIQVSSMLVGYLVYVSTMLESWAADEFPGNALHVMSLVERLTKKLTELAITPTGQAVLVSTRHSLQYPDARFAEAETRVQNLRKMERLKTVYECRLSYENFMELTTEQICYRILDSAIKNPNTVAANIAKFCRPYMNEHNLDSDMTLFGFVHEASRKSMGIVTASNPWDEHCLLVCNTIEKYAIKCRAVTMIAKGAHPPWSDKLSKTVNAVLKDPQTDTEIVKELQRVVHLMQLGVILTSYGVPIALVDSVVNSPSQFISFIQYIFRGSDRHPDEARRLLDAVKAMNLYREIVRAPGITMTIEYVHVMFATYLQQSNNTNKAMIQYVSSLGSGLGADKGKRGGGGVDASTAHYAQRVLDSLINTINFSVEQKDEASIADRLSVLVSAESLMEHFLRDSPEYGRITQKLMALRKLQEKYQIWATFAHLDCSVWRSRYLQQYIMGGERTFTEIQLFASALAISVDEAAYTAIETYQRERQYNGCITLMRAFLLSVSEPSQRLTETCVSACASILVALPTICPEDIDEAAEANLIDEANFMVECIRDVLSSIVDAADRYSSARTQVKMSDAATKKTTESAASSAIETLTTRSMSLIETVMLMFDFTNLFTNVISQCLMESNDDSAGSSAAATETQNAVRQQGLILGMGRRVGVYQIQNDGPLLARMEAVPLLCAVAPAVGTNLATMTAEDRSTFMHSMQSKWEDVFQFLSIQNQYLLEYSSRIYAANIPCCLEVRQSILDGIYNCARNVCERALEMHPCDLWTTCLMLGSFEPIVTKKLIGELRTWIITTNRRSAQTMINYLRTVQLFVVAYGIKDHVKPLSDSFIKYMWAKRLGKVGVNSAVNGTNIKKALDEFARAKLDPSLVYEFLTQFAVEREVPRHMMNYAMILLRNAARESDREKSNRLLELGRLTLKQSACSEDAVFDRLSSLLFLICPYNHEVLGYLVNILNELLKRCIDDGKQAERESFVGGCRSVLEFLSGYRRLRAIGPEEVGWFLRHSKLLAGLNEDSNSTLPPTLDKLSDTTESGLLMLYRNGWHSANMTNETSDALEGLLSDKGRSDLLVSSVPPSAEHLLPFHPFMFVSKDDITKHLVPMVLNETTIYSVKDWQLLVRCVSWLSKSNDFSRVELLSTAIVRKAQECIDKGDEITVIERSTISNLMLSTAPAKLVGSVAFCLSNIPLSNVKIEVLQIAVDAATVWLTTEDPSEPMSAEDRGNLEEGRRRLIIQIRKLRTRQILQTAGLYNTKTGALDGDPAALVSYVYSNCIDWNQPTDIDRKSVIIGQLAGVNEMDDLSTVQMELVRQWLTENAAGADDFAVDLNDTMGNDGGAQLGGFAPDMAESEIYLLPYSDASITGIVHLLRLIAVNPAHTILMIRHLLMFVNESRDAATVTGGYRTMIRAACVLLRAYSSEQLYQVAQVVADRICEFVELAQYGRLLELANQGMMMNAFKKEDRRKLALRLTGTGIRHTPQLIFALGCLVVDHDIADRQIVDFIVNKVYNARKMEMLILLLQHIRHHPSLRNLKNLPTLWSRAYDHAIAAIAPSSPDRLERARHWLNFCLSCPVQGGRAFDPICSSLRSKGNDLAALLVQSVADYTQAPRTHINAQDLSNKMALALSWTGSPPSDSASDSLVENDDSMEQDESMFI